MPNHSKTHYVVDLVHKLKKMNLGMPNIYKSGTNPPAESEYRTLDNLLPKIDKSIYEKYSECKKKIFTNKLIRIDFEGQHAYICNALYYVLFIDSDTFAEYGTKQRINTGPFTLAYIEGYNIGFNYFDLKYLTNLKMSKNPSEDLLFSLNRRTQNIGFNCTDDIYGWTSISCKHPLIMSKNVAKAYGYFNGIITSVLKHLVTFPNFLPMDSFRYPTYDSIMEIGLREEVTVMPTFNPSIIDDFIKILKDKFSSEHIEHLKKLMDNSLVPQQKLLFNGTGKLLVVAFKRLKENDLIIGIGNSQLVNWICNNFKSIYSGKPKDYKPSYVYDLLTNDNIKINHELFTVKKNRDGVTLISKK